MRRERQAIAHVDIQVRRAISLLSEIAEGAASPKLASAKKRSSLTALSAATSLNAAR